MSEKNINEKYTYLVKSKNLSKSDIKKTFKMRKNWEEFNDKRIKRINEKTKNPDFLYVDNIYLSFNKKLRNYKAEFKNIVSSEDKQILTNKALFYEALKKLNNINCEKYLIPQDNINLQNIFLGKDNIDNYKKYFNGNNVGILKIIKGAAGNNIHVFEDFQKFKKYCEKIISKYNHKWNNKKLNKNPYANLLTLNEWTLQKYINNPLLFNGRKFHLRTYFLYYKNHLGEKNGYLFKLANIWTARDKYKKGDYTNKYIHDSRGKTTNKAYFFPKDFKQRFGKENTYKIQKQLLDLHKYLLHILNANCYLKESNNCYEIFGGDIIITNNMKIKLIEYNSNFGALKLPGDNTDYMFHMLNESISKTVDTLLKPEKNPKLKNMFIKIKKYKTRSTKSKRIENKNSKLKTKKIKN